MDKALTFIASLGVDGVEFVARDQDQGDNPLAWAARMRKRCDALKLKIAGYCVGAELLSNPADQKSVVAKLKRDVDVACALGTDRLRHDVTHGPHKGESFTQVLRAVVPAIREVADHAAGCGVVTSLENHGFYLQTAERVEKLIRAVDRKNFGLTLDLGNFLCLNQDPTAATRQLARHAVMVHAKDFHVRNKKAIPSTGWFATPTPIALRGAILGHGTLDLPAQFRILKKAGYAGWVSIEFEGMEPPEQGLSLGVDYARSLMKS